MKAKEYAARYLASPTHETLVQIGIEFDKETSELVKARGVKTDSAFLAVLKEIDLKWQSFASKAGLNPMGYRMIMKNLHPSTANFAWPELDKTNS